MKKQSQTYRLTGAFLLCFFLFGGFIAPIVHDIHHGLEWAENDRLCDHSGHTTGFEQVASEFDLDHCTACANRSPAERVESIVLAEPIRTIEWLHTDRLDLNSLSVRDASARAPPATA